MREFGHADETVEATFTVPYMSLIVSVSPYMGNLLCRCGACEEVVYSC